MDTTARDHLQRCFVLHRRDFRNTSLLLDVLSGPYGRVALVAKGAKRPKGGAATLAPFQPLWLSWSGNGEVKTLVRHEAAGPALTLHGTALYCGFYLNELLLRVLGRGDPHDHLLAYYSEALQRLADGDAPHGTLRRFELSLLREIGYEVPLDQDCADAKPIDPSSRYAYEADQGFRVLGLAETGFSVSGETLLRLAGGEPLSGIAAREARDLMRRLLAPHLGSRPMKSRELLEQAARLRGEKLG